MGWRCDVCSEFYTRSSRNRCCFREQAGAARRHGGAARRLRRQCRARPAARRPGLESAASAPASTNSIRPGRRFSRIDGAHRRRAGHRQVHSASPGAGALQGVGQRVLSSPRCIAAQVKLRADRLEPPPPTSVAHRDDAETVLARRRAWSRRDDRRLIQLSTRFGRRARKRGRRECRRLIRFAKESGTAVFLGALHQGGGIAVRKNARSHRDTCSTSKAKARSSSVLRATQIASARRRDRRVRMTEPGSSRSRIRRSYSLAIASTCVGSGVTALGGTRPLLVESQALAAKRGSARRSGSRPASTVVGWRSCSPCSTSEPASVRSRHVFVNVVGGVISPRSGW